MRHVVKPRKAAARLAGSSALPARPVVVSEGVELETVWYPHRDAASLLPGDERGSILSPVAIQAAFAASRSRRDMGRDR